MALRFITNDTLPAYSLRLIRLHALVAVRIAATGTRVFLALRHHRACPLKTPLAFPSHHPGSLISILLALSLLSRASPSILPSGTPDLRV